MFELLFNLFSLALRGTRNDIRGNYKRKYKILFDYVLYGCLTHAFAETRMDQTTIRIQIGPV